jgi:hypothetical protein
MLHLSSTPPARLTSDLTTKPYSRGPMSSILKSFLEEISPLDFLSTLGRASTEECDTAGAECERELGKFSRDPASDYIVPAVCVKEPGMPLNYTYGTMKLSCINAVRLYNQSERTEADRIALWSTLSEQAENMTDGELRKDVTARICF